MRTKKPKPIYAIYKGDDFLFMGTLKECADYLKVSKRTVSFYGTETYRNRGKGEYGDRLIVIKVEEGD